MLRKSIKFLFLTIFVIVVSQFIYTMGIHADIIRATSSSPKEICFGVNYPLVGMGGDINLSSKTANVHNTLFNTGGYYSQYYYINNSGATILNNLAGRAITYITGHDSPGEFYTVFSQNGQAVEERVTALQIFPTNDPYWKGSYLKKPETNTATQLKYAKMAYFSSCNSAVTHSTKGNLIHTAAALGADSSVGFSDTLYEGPSGDFDSLFFYYWFNGVDSNGYHLWVYEAAESALFDVRASYAGWSGGTYSYTIAPVDSGRYIFGHPPAYGQYYK